MKKLIAYTDGAARDNPGSGGWGVVLSVTHTSDDSREGDVIERGGRLPETTNNRAELTAVIETLKWAQDNGIQTVVVYTDSQYLIRGITSWRHNWQTNGWETRNGDSVKNKKLWQDLIKTQDNLDVTYEHVEGHAGIPANERADDIATAFADKDETDLYAGPAEEYELSLAPESQKLDNSPVYLSLINDEVMQHDSWESCKQRVNGVRAEYRKVETIPERDKVLESWGKEIKDITS
jgi:ribonuclease HI